MPNVKIRVRHYPGFWGWFNGTSYQACYYAKGYYTYGRTEYTAVRKMIEHIENTAYNTYPKEIERYVHLEEV